MTTTFPRRADGVSGGELSHSSARSREANSDRSGICVVVDPWRKGTRTPVDVVGCCTCASFTKPTIGAPIAMARTAAIRGLFIFIDECLCDSDRGCRGCEKSARARRAPKPSDRFAERPEGGAHLGGEE